MSAVTYPDPLNEPQSPPIVSLPTAKPGRRRLAMTITTLCIVVLGAVSYLLWPSGSTTTTEPIVTGMAEQTVTAWLHGNTAVLRSLVAAELPPLNSTDHYVRSASSVSVSTSTDGWRVVVAVDVLQAVPGGFGDPRLDHYEVTILDRPTGPMIAGLPALVPAPAAPALVASPLPEPADDPLASEATAYLAWLLTGVDGAYEGSPIVPAPYDAIDVTGMQRTEDGGVWTVAVAVTGTRADGTRQPMHYFLDADETDGGWSVSLRGS